MTDNKTQKNPQQNINTEQFFTLEKKGRDGIVELVTKHSNELWSVHPEAANKTKKSAYLKKLISHLQNNENIKPLLQTREGMFSLYQKTLEACELGLNMGGMRPHAHLMTYQSKKGPVCQMIPTADGFRWITCSGVNAMFKDINCEAVYENDKIDIDVAKGELSHKPALTVPGAFIGCYVQIMHKDKDERDIVKWINKDEIFKIRDNHSVSWKAYKDEKKEWAKTSPWLTDEIEMCKKTAVKKALKPYVSQSAGLAALDALDFDKEQPRDNKGVAERMAEKLDNIEITPVEIINEKKEDAQPEESSESTLF